MGMNHVVPQSHFVKVLGALLSLTVVTVLVAPKVTGFDIGVFNTFLAILIASVKAGLVMAIFMELKYDKKLYLAIFLSSVFFVSLLFAISWMDIISRVQEVSPL